MRVIARNKLIRAWEKHPDAEAGLRHWYQVASAASWATPLEAASAFSRAKAVNADRVRFDIAGGDYRLIVAFDWRRGIAFIKFVGTHAEYDRVDATTISDY